MPRGGGSPDTIYIHSIKYVDKIIFIDPACC